jgi:hypothetical protein
MTYVGFVGLPGLQSTSQVILELSRVPVVGETVMLTLDGESHPNLLYVTDVRWVLSVHTNTETGNFGTGNAVVNVSSIEQEGKSK